MKAVKVHSKIRKRKQTTPPPEFNFNFLFSKMKFELREYRYMKSRCDPHTYNRSLSAQKKTNKTGLQRDSNPEPLL